MNINSVNNNSDNTDNNIKNIDYNYDNNNSNYRYYDDYRELSDTKVSYYYYPTIQRKSYKIIYQEECQRLKQKQWRRMWLRPQQHLLLLLLAVVVDSI